VLEHPRINAQRRCIEAAEVAAADVSDVGPPVGQGVDLDRIRVDADDGIAGSCCGEQQRQTDVAQSDHRNGGSSCIKASGQFRQVCAPSSVGPITVRQRDGSTVSISVADSPRPWPPERAAGGDDVVVSTMRS
jgi:hypothetical protein